MEGLGPSLFDGLSSAELERVQEHLERRRFPAGATLLAEGDDLGELYVVKSGAADIFVADGAGRNHLVGHAGPGATVGEMSMLSGQAASATVCAATDLEVLVLPREYFHDLAATLPGLYRNLAVILSARLAHTNRRAVPDPRRQVAVLLDCGAPPIVAYALAGSVAWHTRRPTLLVWLAADDPPAELAALAASGAAPPESADTAGPREARAYLLVQPPTGSFAPAALPRTLETLRRRYDHVLVAQADGPPPAGVPARCVRLADRCGPPPSPSDEPGYTLWAWADGGAPRPGPDGVLPVPPLAPADERALAAGVLPPQTPAGAALGWAARDLAGLKVGIALGAGQAKGYAHLGVLEVLARAGVPFDYLAGSSVGAAMAAFWASGHAPADVVRLLDKLARGLFRPGLSTSALLSSSRWSAAVRHIAGEARIEDLPLPVAVVATDLVTLQEVVFREGLLWPALVGSMSIPGIFPPQRVGPYLLVDGGVLTCVPTHVAADMGADTVIAVRLTAPGARPVDEARAPTWSPSLPQVILRSLAAMQTRLATHTASAATLVIEPDFSAGSEPGLRRFTEGRRYVPVGAAAAEAALPRLAAVLPWLRG